MLWLLLSLLCFSATWDAGVGDCSHLHEDGNEFADRVLSNWKDNFDDDDTFKLEDVRKGSVQLTKGKVWGLDELVRTGEARLDCARTNEDAVVLSFAFNSSKPLRIRYEWQHELISRTLKGVAYIRTNTFQATGTLRHVVKGDEPSQVLELDITKLEGVEVDVSGLAHVGWMISRVTSSIANLFQETFGNLVEKRMMKIFNSVLLQMNARSKHE